MPTLRSCSGTGEMSTVVYLYISVEMSAGVKVLRSLGVYYRAARHFGPSALVSEKRHG